ncbi:glycosyltransferase family 2 protein [Paludibaculum fermentans]|uniref:Glycosyltransferase family 2 protein n=1 Tax=Paludibaculum fermentans TaxID=1473598 RepID=A0A7S7SJM2_PALFE|nr:glycosyltransferase family 2 protein [Paludibaculum fermentans]QOY88237.1 glycosyltransferase family 2 protein [Paludibaculum fermentans]
MDEPELRLVSLDLTIVLPAYNEELSITQVVGQWCAVAAKAGNGRVIVVDDGSSDRTRHILDTLLQIHPELVVIHQQNAGHGAAIQLGYRRALDMGSDWIFQTDSDGQTSPADFETFWRHREECPFQTGERNNRHDPAVRVLLSRWHERIVDLLFDVPVRDPNVPFRLIRADLLKRYLELIPSGTFAPNVLMSVLASRQGVFTSRTVSHSARTAGQTSVKGWRMIRMGVRSLREYLAFRRVVRRAIL